MDGILKRLLGLNQLLLVLFTLCFFSCNGRLASTGALEIARDFEALNLLKGKERDPNVLCASPTLQQSVDAEVQEGDAGLRYRAVREAFTAFLRDQLHFDDVEIGTMKRGGGHLYSPLEGQLAYFLITPQLKRSTAEKSVPCPLGVSSDPVIVDRPEAPPDSVETILDRSRAVSLSREVTFPVSWAAPARAEDAVPSRCQAATEPPAPPPSFPPPSPPRASGAHPRPTHSVVGSGAVAPSAVPPGKQPEPELPPTSVPTPPRRMVMRECTLARIFFDGGALNLVWHFSPPPIRQEPEWYETKTLPATGESRTSRSPFLVSELTSIEDGWKKRIIDVGSDAARQKTLAERYGGISIDNALQQSQKVYSDLIGNVTLFGWNLLPEWFPLAVGGSLAIVLFAVFVTCRSARSIAAFRERSEKLTTLESIFFLSLSTPAGTVATWVLIPVATLAMSFAGPHGGASFFAELALGGIAIVLGAFSCHEFWKEPPETRSAAIDRSG